MKLQSVVVTACIFSFILITGNSFADVIVDTAPGITSADTPAWYAVEPGYGDKHGYAYAAEFTVSQGYTITDVSAFLYDIYGDPYGDLVDHQLTVAIYSDDTAGGEVPGTELYSSAFLTGTTKDWHGVSDVAWDIDAGTYWVAFETRAEDGFRGYIGRDASNPLGNEAGVWNSGTGSLLWAENDALDLMVRISGTPEGDPGDPIPEPATLLLLGTGIAGLAGSRLRKKK